MKPFEGPLSPGNANRTNRVRSRGPSHRTTRGMRIRLRSTNGHGDWLLLSRANYTGCCAWQVAANRKERLPADRFRVVATNSMLGDGGHRVGGERIASTIVVGRGADTHTCEPMSQDRVAVVEAAVDFEKGLGAEPGFECLYEASGSAAVRCVVTQPIQPRVGKNAVGKLRQAQDVWHSPAFAAWMVRAGRDAFVEIDPMHANESIRFAAADEVELQRLRKEIHTETEMLSPARRHLVTTPDMFGDLAEKNRSLVSSILNATSSETSEQGAGECAATMERTREEQGPAICTEIQHASHLIKQVERGARSLHELRPDASSSSGFCEFLGHAIDRRLDRQTILVGAILGHG